MLFADRLEVWNPGELPPALTLAQLRVPHPSIPRNPLISDPLFLAHYVERAGTGTLDMIALCRAAGLPEPEFRQDGGQFVQAIWRDWLTPAVISALALSSRQTEAVRYATTQGRITNAEYRPTAGYDAWGPMLRSACEFYPTRGARPRPRSPVALLGQSSSEH